MIKSFFLISKLSNWFKFCLTRGCGPPIIIAALLYDMTKLPFYPQDYVIRPHPQIFFLLLLLNLILSFREIELPKTAQIFGFG